MSRAKKEFIVAGVHFKKTSECYYAQPYGRDDVFVLVYEANELPGVQIWTDHQSITSVYVSNKEFDIYKTLAQKVLPHKIATLKDDRLYLNRSKMYLKAKLVKELQKEVSHKVSLKKY